MLQVICLEVGQLKTNCYVVWDTESLKTIIIDPGDDAEFIEQTILDNKLQPISIIATHGHFDHILAATELKLAYNIPFFMHKNDAFLLNRMNSSAKFFIGVKSNIPPPEIDKNLVKESDLTIEKSKLTIIETPGHTPGSISLYSKKEHTVFVGDLVFENGSVGRTDFAYSSKKDLITSIKIITELPSNTKVLSGHGNQTSVSVIRRYKEL